MSNNDELKGMLMTFRVSELQTLLGYASQNRTGRKTELQARAIGLLKSRSIPHLNSIQAKIRELYKTAQEGAQAAAASAASTSAAVMNNPRNMSLLPPSGHPPPQALGPMAPPPNHPTPSPSPFMSLQVDSLQNRQMYTGNLYGYAQKLPSTTAAAPPAVPTPEPGYSIHPDVKLKRLPFFDVLSELIKPSSLVPPSNRANEASFMFYLTSQQATDIASNREVGLGKNDYPIQVQVRFCLLDTNSEQEDLFPPGICVKVNGKLAQLPNPIPTTRPGTEPRRPPRPVNISPLVKLCPAISNHISISWTPEYGGRTYVVVVYLVRKLSAVDLLNRLKNKGARHSDYTTGLIKEKLAEDSDCEIATTSLRVSLMCPLARTKLSVPCRSTTCSHLQCFEASSFLQMNEKRPTWSCPVCNSPILFDTLVVDGYFQEVLASPKVTNEIQEIQVHKDGSWSVSKTDKDDPKPANKVSSSTDVAVEEILDDEDLTAQPTKMEADSGTAAIEKPANAVSIDLTESDEENCPAPAPQVTAPQKQDHLVSDLCSSSGNNNQAREDKAAPAVISLDSPSPPHDVIGSHQQQQLQHHRHNHHTSQPSSSSSSTTSQSSSNACADMSSSYEDMSHLYPKVMPTNKPLIMQIRMPPETGRYHPY